MNIIKNKIECLFLKNKVKYDSELIAYGIVVLVRYLPVIIISLSLNLIQQSLLYYLELIFLYFFLRSHLGGFHFKNNLICSLFSILFLSLFPSWIKYYGNTKISINYLIFLFLLFVVVIGPIDNTNKRLSINEKKYHKKIIVYSLLIIDFLINIISIVSINKVIIYTIIFQVFSMFIGYFINLKVHLCNNK